MYVVQGSLSEPDDGESGEAYDSELRPGNGPYTSNPDSYGRYKVTINIQKPLHERLMFQAREEGIARHGLIIKLLEEGLAKREKRE